MVVCDLDDTLCDSRWRAPLPGRWAEASADAALDKPQEPLRRILRSLIALGTPLALLSSRTETFRPMTVSWLLKHDVLADDVLMRPPGNYMSNADLKLLLTEPFFDQIELIVDSREEVLAAFRGVLDVPMMLWTPGPQRP